MAHPLAGTVPCREWAGGNARSLVSSGYSVLYSCTSSTPVQAGLDSSQMTNPAVLYRYCTL